jgi:hypothetical protein
MTPQGEPAIGFAWCGAMKTTRVTGGQALFDAQTGEIGRAFHDVFQEMRRFLEPHVTRMPLVMKKDLRPRPSHQVVDTAAAAPGSRATSRKPSRIRGGCCGDPTAAAMGLAVRGVRVCVLGKLGDDPIRYNCTQSSQEQSPQKNRHVDKPRGRSSNSVPAKNLVPTTGNRAPATLIMCRRLRESLVRPLADRIIAKSGWRFRLAVARAEPRRLIPGVGTRP